KHVDTHYSILYTSKDGETICKLSESSILFSFNTTVAIYTLYSLMWKLRLAITSLLQAGHSCPGMLVFEISASAPISSNDLLGHIPNPLEILTSSEGCTFRWNVFQNE